VEPAALSFLPHSEPSDFIQDVFPAMLRAGLPLFAYNTTDFLFDMGTHERYARLTAELQAV
jgi:mannose-1-phosphate guanylyltransferase/phosphomannomutase